MSLRQLMNKEELAYWILRKLGAPLVRVELTSEHLSDSIEDARRWFASKKGHTRLKEFTIPGGTNIYSLPDEVDTVLEVMERDSIYGTAYDPTFLGLSVDGSIPVSGMLTGGFAPYSTYTQFLQNMEMGKRVFSAEFDWRQVDRELHIFPTEANSSVGSVPFGTFLMFYKDNSWTIEQLSERDHDLVKRFALKESKIVLARIRGKYEGGFSSSQGSVNLDAQTLLGEAQTEGELLEKEISMSGFPMGVMLG